MIISHLRYFSGIKTIWDHQILFEMLPNVSQLTVIIIYNNQKYGLLLPGSSTIRQIKKEIMVYYSL